MTNKITCVVSGYPDAYSEYGKLTVSFFEALLKIKGDEWDIKVLSIPDENTAMGYVDDQWEWELDQHIIHVLTEQPEIWIQIGEPHTYQRFGKLYNIGVGLANETNILSKSTIDGINRMDLMLATSNHAKSIIENTIIEYTNNVELTVTEKVQIPVQLLEVGTLSFLDTYEASTPIQSGIVETYCFIADMKWGVDHDVNNVTQLIHTFYSSFAGKGKKPALILSTSLIAPSIIDIERIKSRIERIKLAHIGKQLPNIYLINGMVNDKFKMGIYNHSLVKAMVNTSSNNRSAIAMKEFSLTGKPILCGTWGSQSDLGDLIYTVDTKLVDIPNNYVSAERVPNSKYAEIDYNKLANAMVSMYNSKPTKKISKSKFTSSLTVKSLTAILDKFINNQTKSSYIPETEEFQI